MMITCALMLNVFADASAQMYRRENRRGIRDFEKGDYDGAVSHFEQSLSKDSVNVVPLLYNMAYVLHSDRRDSTQNAVKDSLALDYLSRLEKVVKGTEHEYDYHFTKGSIAIDMEDWQSAVDEFKQCIIMDPEDMMARENYVYAKEHLKNDQNGSGGGGGQDQNQDQNQDQKQGDQEKQQGDQDQNQDQQQDQNKDQKEGDQDNQDGQNDRQGEGQPQESKISPQAAKQILQAMQDKEKETQDKVEKRKAAAMKSKQKQKNW